MKIAMALLLVACASRPASADEVASAKAVAADWFAGRYEAVVARMSDGAKKVLTEDKLAKVMARMRDANPSGAVETTVTSTESGKVVLTCRSAAGEETLTVAFDDSGAVVGLLLRPVASANIAKNDGYESKVKLRLPFHGGWMAVNAARSEKSGHYMIPSERWAVDWVKVDAGRRSHKGEGDALTDYYGYRELVVAPADGTVSTVVDGIPENPAHGAGDIFFAAGNTIVLQIAENEYALFCHLVPGSASVKVGQKVHAGDTLGRVGNSGNSTEPHLHFALMDKPRQVEAVALPAKYANVLVNGKRTALAWPDEHDIVAEAP